MAGRGRGSLDKMSLFPTLRQANSGQPLLPSHWAVGGTASGPGERLLGGRWPVHPDLVAGCPDRTAVAIGLHLTVEAWRPTVCLALC